MNWLTQAFAQQSIAWIVITTVTGLIAEVVSSWLTYRFVTKQQIRDTLAAEIEKQRRTLNMETRKEKQEKRRKNVFAKRLFVGQTRSWELCVALSTDLRIS